MANTRNVLTITEEEGIYTVVASDDSSVNELAFTMMVIIRSLFKQKLIKSAKEFLDLVKKYYEDPQYRPLEEPKDGAQ